MLALTLAGTLAFAAPEREVCPAALPLEGAVALAAERSPEALALARAARDRGELDDDIPRFFGNPLLRASAGPRVLHGGVAGVEGGVGVYSTLDLAGGGRAEREAAALSREALLAERDRARLDAQLAAARTWLALWEAQQTFAVAAEEDRVASELAAALARAAAAKSVSSADAARARRYASETALELRRREGERFERAIELGVALGCAAQGVTLGGELPEAPRAPVSRESLAAGHPGARARDLEAQAQRAHGEALLRGALGKVDVGFVAEKDGPDQYRGLFEVQIPLPFFDRAQRERASAAAAAAVLEGERDAARRAAEADLARAEHEVEHTREVLDLAESSLGPAAADVERLEEAAFEAGAGTVIELLRARADRLAAARSRVAAAAAHAAARWQLSILLTALAGETKLP